MEEGGDACDAAVAVSLALGVAEPFYSGLGGGGVSLIWRADENKARFIDFSNQCPVGMEPGIFACNENGKHTGEAHSRGHRSILIPGLLRGLEAIHREYGRLPWGDLFESAIRLADAGFPVGWFFCRQQAEPRFRRLCENYPEFAGIHSASGEPLSEGECLRQPDLAKTLREIAERGPAHFYDGALSETIAEEVRSGGGYLGASDMKDYRVRWMEPLASSYRDHLFFTAPPPSSGLILIQILNFLEILLPDWDAADEVARGLAFARAMRAAFSRQVLGLRRPLPLRHACGAAFEQAIRRRRGSRGALPRRSRSRRGAGLHHPFHGCGSSGATWSAIRRLWAWGGDQALYPRAQASF